MILSHAIGREGPPGMGFTRWMIALAVGKAMNMPAAEAARARWGGDSQPARILKAAVEIGAINQTWPELWDARQAAIEFLEYVRPLTIIGKLAGLRYVPSNLPYAAMSGGAVAAWTGTGKAAKVSRAAFARDSLMPLKCTALVVQSNELLQANSTEGELLIRNDLARAVIQLSDSSFISPTNTGVANETPASVTHVAAAQSPTDSSGDVADDIATAIDGFGGDLETSSWIMHPRLSTKIGLRVSGNAANSLGARGGVLAGLPVIASASCPDDLITLLDSASVAIVDEGAELRVSKSGTVELDDDPQGAGLSPLDSAGNNHVSLFQNEMTGVLVVRRINWKLARANAVYCITSANYTAAVS
jgi:hypothetical protein